MPGSEPISLPRLAVALTLCGLAITRISLVIHEFVGHGGLVVALGSDLDDWRLFLFGGGWVSFSRAQSYSLVESHFIAVGGVLLELGVGALALWCVRWLRLASPLRIAVVALAAADIMHAFFYAVVGTHYGFGDGRLLHHALGDARPWLVGVGAIALGGLGYAFARRLLRELHPWLAGISVARAMARIAIAAAIAGGVHAGLMFGERAITDDPTYAEIMKQQSQRDVDREMRQQIRTRKLTDAELRALRARLEREHRPFPLRPFAYVLIGLGVIGGAYSSLRDRKLVLRADAPSWLGLSPLALACGLSLVLVLLLRSPWWR